MNFRDPRDGGATEDPDGMVEAMAKSRAERAAALGVWTDKVEPGDLREADTYTLRRISELAESVRAARAAHRSWSEIGGMLGVLKPAAQRKYGTNTPS
jgi:hypothetical protein